LKNKHYTIFFASEKNNYSRSFTVNKVLLICFFIIGILILLLSSYGFYQLINEENIFNENQKLKLMEFEVNNMLSDLNLSGLLDSTHVYAKFLEDYFENDTDFIPNLSPVSGYVTQGFDVNSEYITHPGIDIAAKYKDQIVSSASGMVIFSGKYSDLGNTLIISHANGFFTVYGHNDTNLVDSRTFVDRGEVIALVGQTGNSKAPHLHFEIWKNNKMIDPREIIKEYNKKDVSIR